MATPRRASQPAPRSAPHRAPSTCASRRLLFVQLDRHRLPSSLSRAQVRRPSSSEVNACVKLRRSAASSASARAAAIICMLLCAWRQTGCVASGSADDPAAAHRPSFVVLDKIALN
eukprot:3745869-Prymnesium_polylepis.1